ncbi:MAG TPA: hypothetical protein VJZ26_06075 [Blastocatellia bacterium]|nr:hypothetical protein [Blastocatellia bacterium]
MKKVFKRAATAFTVAMCFAVCASAVRADVKIKAKATQGGTVSEQTTYIKGRRQRVEMANGMMVSIMQCDLQRSLQIIPQSKTYIVTPFNQTADGAERAANQPDAGKSAARRGGVIMTTITYKDTGERKEMFGYAARHIITTMLTESSPDACNKVKSKMEIDAWYIDFGFSLDCDAGGGYQNYAVPNQTGCQDRSQVKQIGQPAKGYPVRTKTTMFDESGKVSFSVEQEVVELSQTTLDAALFDVPAGYREVKSFSEVPGGAQSND